MQSKNFLPFLIQILSRITLLKWDGPSGAFTVNVKKCWVGTWTQIDGAQDGCIWTMLQQSEDEYWPDIIDKSGAQKVQMKLWESHSSVGIWNKFSAAPKSVFCLLIISCPLRDTVLSTQHLLIHLLLPKAYQCLADGKCSVNHSLLIIVASKFMVALDWELPPGQVFLLLCFPLHSQRLAQDLTQKRGPQNVWRMSSWITSI